MKKIILTGDRPTGKLHLGHYVGSLKNRVTLQSKNDYDKMYVFIADAQALTDNFENPEKVRACVTEVMLDYLAIGLDPNKVTFFIQSAIPELTELTFYYMNLVTLARLERNPTVKQELQQKSFKDSIPMGFLTYPVSQTADITAFNATIIPVGIDQLPMIEQAREIVRKFNSIYGDVLTEPKELLSTNELEQRLPGLDGKAKMSKSLDNCIYLADTEEEIKRKVMSAYTDPNHIKIEDKGQIEGNMVFTYLDVFSNEEHFKKYIPEYNNLNELKDHYRKGGLGDIKIKNFLNDILQELLKSIRERREEYQKNIPYLYEILESGTKEARITAQETLNKVKEAMKINYFKD